MANATVSIDIGSYALKAVQGTIGRGGRANVTKVAQSFNSTGLSVPTDENTAEQLGKLIDVFLHDNGMPRTDVRLSLEESLVSTKVISIPPLTDAELASAITWQAEQYIPIPIDELALEYQVLYRPEKRDQGKEMQVLLVGVRKPVVEKVVDMFVKIGIEPTLLETQTISLLRALQFTPEDPPTLMVHLGGFHTDMAIVVDGEPRFVYTNQSGGQALTRAVEIAAQMDAKQAEEYKRAYGIDEAQLQGKMREVLLPSVHGMIIEMQKALQFFLSQSDTQQIKRVLLSGGGAQLPGLVQYVTEQLGMEVLIASPFATSEGNIPPTDHPTFTVCMGMLMRTL